MKKTLSIMLCIVMLLSLVVVSASAVKADDAGKVAAGYTPEGTGIDSLAGITDAAGKYYLTKDVTVDATIETVFTGTLDGNGHTITVKAPLFKELAGTVKNLTLAGAVDYTAVESHAGVLTIVATGNVTIKNCKNTATVKGYMQSISWNGSEKPNCRTGAAGFIGFFGNDVNIVIEDSVNTADINGYVPSGFIGCGNGGSKDSTTTIVMKNCLNTGNLSTKGESKPTGGNNPGMGGMLAHVDHLKSATFENCTNTGNFDASENTDNAPSGGIVGYIYASNDNLITATFKNCTNSGNITTPGFAGGIAGKLNTYVTMENCTNTGAMKSLKDDAGGMLGENAATFPNEKEKAVMVFKNCTNKGTVECKGHAGGLAGQSTAVVEVTGCVNEANITSQASAGGLFGRLENTKDTSDVHKVTNCVNTGNITGAGSGTVAGLVGYAYTGAECHAEIEGCLTTGTITGASWTSQFLAYANSTKTVIKNNLGLGKLVASADGANLCFIGGSSLDISQGTYEGNYVAGDDGMTLMFKNTATSVEFKDRAEGSVVSATEAQLASGEIAFALNTAIGKNVFRQTLGTDKAPSLDASAKEVIKNADGTFSNPKPVTPTPTGDIAASVAVVALVALFGAAYVSKKVR